MCAQNQMCSTFVVACQPLDAIRTHILYDGLAVSFHLVIHLFVNSSSSTSLRDQPIIMTETTKMGIKKVEWTTLF